MKIEQNIREKWESGKQSINLELRRKSNVDGNIVNVRNCKSQSSDKIRANKLDMV